jgi:hypothetical protein
MTLRAGAGVPRSSSRPSIQGGDGSPPALRHRLDLGAPDEPDPMRPVTHRNGTAEQTECPPPFTVFLERPTSKAASAMLSQSPAGRRGTGGPKRVWETGTKGSATMAAPASMRRPCRAARAADASSSGMACEDAGPLQKELDEQRKTAVQMRSSARGRRARAGNPTL